MILRCNTKGFMRSLIIINKKVESLFENLPFINSYNNYSFINHQSLVSLLITTHNFLSNILYLIYVFYKSIRFNRGWIQATFDD